MGRAPVGKKAMTAAEANRRQRVRQRNVSHHARAAGYEPANLWMRPEVKAAFDRFALMHYAHHVDALDYLVTKALRAEGYSVPPPPDKIGLDDVLVSNPHLVSTEDGKEICWNEFSFVQLTADVASGEELGDLDERTKLFHTLYTEALQRAKEIEEADETEA